MGPSQQVPLRRQIDFPKHVWGCDPNFHHVFNFEPPHFESLIAAKKRALPNARNGNKIQMTRGRSWKLTKSGCERREDGNAVLELSRWVLDAAGEHSLAVADAAAAGGRTTPT